MPGICAWVSRMISVAACRFSLPTSSMDRRKSASCVSFSRELRELPNSKAKASLSIFSMAPAMVVTSASSAGSFSVPFSDAR